MRRMLQMFFGTFVGSGILTAAGFMGPAPYWPGFGGIGLMVASFIAMVVTERVDTRTRYSFQKILNRYRRIPQASAFQDEIDRINGRIVRKESLVEISHDMGELRGKLLAKGHISDERISKPESDV